MRVIKTNNALAPAGHYSQAIEHDGLIFVSGQLAADPHTGKQVKGTAGEETERILKNIALILEEGKSDIHHVLKITVYVSDMSMWDEVNAVYAKFFGAHKPARCIVPVGDLHFGYKVEIDAIAAVKK